MNIYRIYIFIVWFVFTPFLMIDKKGERNSENDFEFICMFIFTIGICIYVFVYTKGEKHSSLMHVYVEHSLHIFMFIAMHELRGSFMKLIFNPCIYNSMSFVIIKKGRLLAQKQITLVLMMINSYSYNTNDLVFNNFQIFDQILVGI